MYYIYLFIYLNLILSFLFVILSFIFKFMKIFFVIEWMIFKIESVSYDFMIMVDWVSLLFISVVFMVSSMILYYSIEYMYSEFKIKGFIYLIMLFILSMFMMILSPQLISILLGWDGLGLISYCLVIYYDNYFSFNSGMLTFLSNRFGDVMFLMGISFMLFNGSWMFYIYNNYYILIFFLVILGAMTKSAQYPFSMWLPAAMAAPTPISALVHSSTLVTAGVYLIMRLNLILNLNVLSWLLFISVFTMFFSGLMASLEMDFKKIIAYSTLSQLGFMIMSLSLGLKFLGLFHLLTHALFKSLLFLCAGFIIHNMNGNQDIRYMGSLSMKIPFIMILFNVCSLSLCGFPFLSGFYSKDYILEYTYMLKINFLIYYLVLISMVLTVAYSFRLFIYLFYNDFGGYSLNYIHEGMEMSNSMHLLGYSAVMNGSLYNWLFFYDFDIIYISFLQKIMIFILIFLGLILGVLLSHLDSEFLFYYLFLSSMMYLSFMFKEIYFKILFWGLKIHMKMDNGWLEIYSNLKFMKLLWDYMYHFSVLKMFKVLILFIFFFFFYMF